MPLKRRTVVVLLSLLGLFLLGTVIVLSSISFYLRIDPAAYITPSEVDTLSNNATGRTHELIPRIIHQTWKTEVLPDRWKPVAQTCRDLMPDYAYKLWTDESGREFIKNYYPWFLKTFDAYIYPIQRADAIRYFVLYHYGGVYIDLDIGCRTRLDPLLVFPVILPKTIPVGVSNDLMFSEKSHSFMAQTIHNLITFDHSLVLNYPTVMFSTGPMFLSAQYGLYTASQPSSPEHPGGEVRILPKSLYGKNAKPGEAPNAFFTHHYGSSWHADDAAFITFLGKWGKLLMWIGAIILVLGILRLFLQRRVKPRHRDRSRRRFALGRYDVVLPRAFQRDGRFHLDLGFVTVSESLTEPSSPLSSLSSEPSSPSLEHPVLPLPTTASPNAPVMDGEHSGSLTSRVGYALRQAGAWVQASLPGSSGARTSPRKNRSRGVMYFLPAIFTPSRPEIEEEEIRLLPTDGTSHPPESFSRFSSYPSHKRDSIEPARPSSSQARNLVVDTSPPPPYENTGANRRLLAPQNNAAWTEWAQTP